MTQENNDNCDISNILIDYIKNINTEENKIVEDINKINLTNYKICLINSDFKFEYKIKRNDLYKFIVNNTNLICSYEPCLFAAATAHQGARMRWRTTSQL